jgi:hypothetical protein
MGTSSDRPQRRRGAPLVWLAGAIAAALLVLGVTGTLSSWTSAVINNNNNSAATTTSVALIETQTAPVNALALPCDTASSTTNSVTCSDINKYGGIGSTGTANANDAYGAPLNPDGTNSQAVTVNLKNDGTGSGTLGLAADTCSNHAYPGSTGANILTYNLCTQMQLAVTCSTPSTYTYTGTVGAFAGGAIGTVAATVSTNCTFTVTLPTSTPAGFASQYLTQALTWTLTAA